MIRSLFRRYLAFLNKPRVGEFLISQEAYHYVENGMTILGAKEPLGLTQTNKILYKLWTVFTLTTLAAYLPIGFVIPFVKSFDTITPNEFFSSLEMFCNIPACSIKVIMLVISKWRVDKAKEILNVIYERCPTHEDRAQVHQMVSRCNIVITIYHCAYMMSPTLSFFCAVLTGHAPWNLLNPFINWRDSTSDLWMASFLELLVLYLAVYGNCIVDLTPMVFGITVRGHLNLLKQRVERLRKNPHSTDQEDYDELILCIQDHKLILDYCDTMRPVISRSMFVQFLVIGLVLASTLIHLIFFATLLTGLSSLWYMSVCPLQSFPFSFTCDKINEDLDKLGEAAFHSNWLDAKRPYKLALIHFMHNIQRPIEFLGGGVLPICLNTNIRMVKMAFSFITFVRQMNLFEKFQH